MTKLLFFLTLPFWLLGFLLEALVFRPFRLGQRKAELLRTRGIK